MPCTLLTSCIPTGDTCSDLDVDPEDESVADDSDSDSDTESITSNGSNTFSIASSTTSYTNSSTALHTLQAAAAVTEFQSEVRQSLERAFAEGHSVDNAAVELKTLRMASNVELRKVREAVVAAIVEKIEVVEEGGVEQRKEIAGVIKRWGALINKIGGVDPVETVEVLQVRDLLLLIQVYMNKLLMLFYVTVSLRPIHPSPSLRPNPRRSLSRRHSRRRRHPRLARDACGEWRVRQSWDDISR